MTESAKVRLRTANSRALPSRFVWWAVAARSAISFQVFQIGGAQNLAITVWSEVRVVLVLWPRLFVSFNALAYASLVPAGGGTGRNWDVLPMTNGAPCSTLLPNTTLYRRASAWSAP